MNEQESLENMKRCPRFDGCSIPRCPLDYFMKERTELPGEPQCPLTRVLVKNKHKKRIEGIMSATMRGLLKFIPSRNQSSDKTAN
jgi:hypothetical protein